MTLKTFAVVGLMNLIAAVQVVASDDPPVSPEEGGWMTLWVLEGDGEISNDEFDRLMVTCDDFGRTESVCIERIDANRVYSNLIIPELDRDGDGQMDAPGVEGPPIGLRYVDEIESDAQKRAGMTPRSLP